MFSLESWIRSRNALLTVISSGNTSATSGSNLKKLPNCLRAGPNFRNSQTFQSIRRTKFALCCCFILFHIFKYTIGSPKSQEAFVSYPESFSFPINYWVASILNFSFQVRRGSKPRLRGLGVQNWTKKPKTE